MRVIAFNGSPRREGNTELLLAEVVRGIQSSRCDVKVHQLGMLSLQPCLHCGKCDDTARCVIKDDMQSIHDDIRKADRIVVASPIFFFSVSAQTKLMIDRCQTFWAEKYIHRKPIPPGPFGRKGLLVLVGGMKRNDKNPGYDCAEASVKAFFRTVNVPEHRTLIYDGVDEKGAIVKHATALSEAFTAGKNLVSGELDAGGERTPDA